MPRSWDAVLDGWERNGKRGVSSGVPNNLDLLRSSSSNVSLSLFLLFSTYKSVDLFRTKAIQMSREGGGDGLLGLALGDGVLVVGQKEESKALIS